MTDGQFTDQFTSVDRISQGSIGRPVTGEFRETLRYPLHLDINTAGGADGSFTLATTVHQGYQQHHPHRVAGPTQYRSDLSNSVDSSDTLAFDANGKVTGRNGQQGSQSFVFRDSLGGCYRSNVATLAGVVSSYANGKRRPDGHNRRYWFTYPDGMPQSGNVVLGR